MAKEWAYIAGDNWMICDLCGAKVRKSLMRERWDNLWVCPADFELRHPQDFVRAKTDKIYADNPRPRPEDIFVENSTCTTRSARVGIAVAGCAVTGSV